jgi:hypothetical protein
MTRRCTKSKSTDLFHVRLAGWRSGVTRANASRRGSSSWAGATSWSTARPACHCVPLPAIWARAAHGWAIAHPASWALLYGSPVPGYHAPAERTVGPGTRVIGALLDAVAAGIATGDIKLTKHFAPQPVSADFERLRQEFGFPGDDAVIVKCFTIWAGVVGAISLEVFGQYGADTLSDPQTVFETQVRLLVAMLTHPDIDPAPFRVEAPN